MVVHDRKTKKTKRWQRQLERCPDDRWPQLPSVDLVEWRLRQRSCQLPATSIANDTNDVADIFRHDRKTKKTKRVGVTSNGVQGDSFSLDPSISSNGRYVAFVSAATNLIANDTNQVHGSLRPRPHEEDDQARQRQVER